jgi:transposase
VQLEVRPVYHKTDNRIRSHVFLCTLAYYLQWHLKQRLELIRDLTVYSNFINRFHTHEQHLETVRSNSAFIRSA